MSIQTLPQSTVRALGASQALTDPASLVKELLDNALDANANSVAITISSNTLDVLQVRDNGCGIAPQDRPLVARRYCTSKICDDEDLKDIGGSSLGFRGEALASAAEMSGSLLISTRIEGEQVATSLNISQKGEVVGQERASLPVGTTVKITDFIKAHPVRRQVALKNVDSCLKKIKRLLQAYAFARPHVRLSLQVLKAKSKKGDWVYAPKPDGNTEDAAFKIVGAACASNCQWSVIEDQGLTLQAFLPRHNADVSKISNIGSFVSIDARPVSSARGLLKQITKRFRESFKAANDKFDGVKEPFIFLEISGGSYDANLEPAKDDVLFENADIVLKVVERLLAAVYKPMELPVPVADKSASASIIHAITAEEPDELFTSLEVELPTDCVQGGSASRDARQDATEQWLDSLNGQSKVAELPAQAGPREPPAMSNMYGFDHDDDVTLADNRPATEFTGTDFAELRRSRNDVTLSNPWVLAKMNTPTRAPVPNKTQHPRSLARRACSANSLARGSSPTSHQRDPYIFGLPTPRPSSPSPPLETFHPSDHVAGIRTAGSRRLVAAPELPSPQNHDSTPVTGICNGDYATVNRDQSPAVPNYPYALDQNGPEPAVGTRLSDIPDATTRPRRAVASRTNKPFVLPTKDHAQREQVWFDRPREARKSRTQRARPDNTDSLVAQGEVGDLLEDARPLTSPTRNRDIRDFIERDASSLVSSMIERRYFGPIPQRRDSRHGDESMVTSGDDMSPATASRLRGFIPASELVGFEEITPHIAKQTLRSSKRRRTTDKTPLRELSTNILMEPAEAEDGIEQRPEASRRAPSRRRSSKGLKSRLPLERVLPGQATHEMILNLSTDIEHLSTLAGTIDQNTSFLSYHEPAENSNSSFELMGDSDIQSLKASLHQLLVIAGSDTDVVDSAVLLEELRAAVYAQRALDEDSEMPMSSV